MSLTPLTYLMMKQQERMQNENSLHGSTTPPLKVYDQTTMIEMKYSNNPLMEIGSKLLLIGKLALTASTLLIIYCSLLPVTIFSRKPTKSIDSSETKTNVAFLVHDSIILDMPFEERDLVEQIVEIFEDTTLGHFPSNISLGTNLGSMVRL